MDMTEPTTMTMLGVTTKALAGGCVGAAVSMILGAGPWWQRLTRGVVGAAAAYFGHTPAAKLLVGLIDIGLDAPHLPSVAEMEPVAAFAIGVVGLVMAQSLMIAALRLRAHADDLVDRATERKARR